MIGRRQYTANTLNTYSANKSKKRTLYHLPSKKLRVLSYSCCSFAIFLLGRRLGSNYDYEGNTRSSSAPPETHRCWLKNALKSGEFKLFSHRSYHDNTQSVQPTCIESLLQLRSIGVNHLDLDLVLDEQAHEEDHSQLIVAHPMEFKGQSEYYSPCANLAFDEMIGTLETVYGNDFFISMEPKAAWGKTQKELRDVALTNLPSTILEKLLENIISHNLSNKCAIILEINDAQDDHEVESERILIGNILQHCQLFKGIRLTDDPPLAMGQYDIIMPTIEFHPSHVHNTAGKVIPPSLQSYSVFWVVDNEADLALAASLHPYGIVSNSPKNIVKIIEGQEWCDE